MWQPDGIYSEYLLRTPVLLKGKGSLRGLYQYPCARIAVIHGSSFHDEELFSSVFRKKEIRFLKRSWNDEPDLESISGTLHELETYRPDLIIAVGGGSVIDGAKLCRLFYEFPYYEPGLKIDGTMLKSRFVAVPTTIGSGAEVSSAAVFIRDEHKEMAVLHELQPDVIVYDESYLQSLSLKQIVFSSADALSHLLEGYVSNIHNSICELMAEEGFVMITEELKHILKDEPIDLERLQYASYLGGIVQNHCLVGAAHAIAHQLSQYHYSHSEAIFLLLPAVIRMNDMDEKCSQKYRMVCKKAGFEDVDGLIDLMKELVNKLDINNRRKELKQLLQKKIEDDVFVRHVMEDRGGKGNPIEIRKEYLEKLIRSMEDE